NWQDRSSDETAFRIDCSTDGNSWSTVTTVGANSISYRVTGLSPETHYYFRVRSIGGDGTSDSSNIAETTTAPAAPSNLIAPNIWSTQVDLAWTDNSISETGFEVDISTDGSNWSVAGTTGSNVTHFRVIGLIGSTRYYFRIRALGTGPKSDASN